MRRLKYLCVTGVATLAFTAAAAASASAHEFLHNGTAVTTALATTSTGGKFVLEAKKGEVVIECASQSATGEVEAGGKDKSGAISFKTCKVTRPSTCELPAAQQTEIKTVATKTELVEEDGVLLDKFTPASGTTFVTIDIVNGPAKECSLVGAHPVTGSSSGVVNNTTESLEFSPAYGALLFGGEAATLAGTSKVTLNNGEALTAK